jgi:hypothetical protein
MPDLDDPIDKALRLRSLLDSGDADEIRAVAGEVAAASDAICPKSNCLAPAKWLSAGSTDRGAA